MGSKSKEGKLFLVTSDHPEGVPAGTLMICSEDNNTSLKLYTSLDEELVGYLWDDDIVEILPPYGYSIQKDHEQPIKEGDYVICKNPDSIFKGVWGRVIKTHLDLYLTIRVSEGDSTFDYCVEVKDFEHLEVGREQNGYLLPVGGAIVKGGVYWDKDYKILVRVDKIEFEYFKSEVFPIAHFSELGGAGKSIVNLLETPETLITVEDYISEIKEIAEGATIND